MLRLKCVDRIKENGLYTQYVLTAENGDTRTLTRDEVLKCLSSNRIVVENLYLSSGRIYVSEDTADSFIDNLPDQLDDKNKMLSQMLLMYSCGKCSWAINSFGAYKYIGNDGVTYYVAFIEPKIVNSSIKIEDLTFRVCWRSSDKTYRFSFLNKRVVSTNLKALFTVVYNSMKSCGVETDRYILHEATVDNIKQMEFGIELEKQFKTNNHCKIVAIGNNVACISIDDVEQVDIPNYVTCVNKYLLKNHSNVKAVHATPQINRILGDGIMTSNIVVDKIVLNNKKEVS